jgi:2-C-methyl-D-erythritol 2,4-cyclodiphosphate synthase
MSYRIGSGVDFHQLVVGRDLWIGGILIPHYKGADGHSDADLLHAVCDALRCSCARDVSSFPSLDEIQETLLILLLKNVL